MKRRKILTKILSLGLASVLAMSMVACGGGSTSSKNPNKIVVWTLAEDLKAFADKYTAENPDIEIETIVISPADYLTKVQTALRAGQSEPDIIVAEPPMLESMYDADFFEDLNQEPYNAQQYEDDIVDYVWKVGQDSQGIQRAISYQITPIGIYYRRDIANEVFGTEDPLEIQKLFKDYNTILETAQLLKSKGYRAFASDGEMSMFSGDTPWVIDGKLNVDQSRKDYMDLAIKLYQDDLTAFAQAWSAPWYQAMQGEIPVFDSQTNVWDEAEVEEQAKDGKTTEAFAYGLPSWGVLTMRDNVGETAGKWGICAGPAKGFNGGTFIGINKNSTKKDLAWDFIKYTALTESTLDWWIEESEGDVVSNKAVLEKNKDVENSIYGNQKLYSFWLEQAEGIDYSKVTKYDKVIGDAWAAAIDQIKLKEKTKEEAIAEFYDVVESTYPELEVVRN